MCYLNKTRPDLSGLSSNWANKAALVLERKVRQRPSESPETSQQHRTQCSGSGGVGGGGGQPCRCSIVSYIVPRYEASSGRRNGSSFAAQRSLQSDFLDKTTIGSRPPGSPVPRRGNTSSCGSSRWHRKEGPVIAVWPSDKCPTRIPLSSRASSGASALMFTHVGFLR